MKKIISSSLLLILWLFLYLLSSGLLQISTQINKLPVIVWSLNIVGISLLTLLVWFYNYLYKDMKRDVSGLDEKFQVVWGPLVLYFLFILLQVLFPVEASDNQQILTDFIRNFPVPAFLNVVIFAPILEEYIFRGLLRGYFFPEISSTKEAIFYCLLSSAIFSMLHLPNTMIHFLIYGTMGFAFSWIYLVKDDLRYSIGLHMFNNFIGTLSILWMV